MKQPDLIAFKRLLKFSGIFNIVSAALLIFPKIYEYYLLFMNDINFSIGLGGLPVEIPTNPLNALLINTAGIDLVLIGTIVLIVSKNPLKNKAIILFNAIGRSLFAFIIMYYVFMADIIRIIVAFGLIDVFISIGFIYYLNKSRNFKLINES